MRARLRRAHFHIPRSVVAISSMNSPVPHTFVAFGSPAYNGASLRIEQTINPLARFEGEGFKLKDVPDITDPRCGFVQRVFDQTAQQTAFYVAGPSSLATTGAAYYLGTHWLDIANKYKDSKSFCIVLRFPSADPHLYKILFEKG